jgi:hypothetical protein
MLKMAKWAFYGFESGAFNHSATLPRSHLFRLEFGPVASLFGNVLIPTRIGAVLRLAVLQSAVLKLHSHE